MEPQRRVLLGEAVQKGGFSDDDDCPNSLAHRGGEGGVWRNVREGGGEC